MSDVRATPDGTRIARIADARSLVAAGRRDPTSAFPEIERLAASDAWQTREVAATALVEIAKHHPSVVLAAARRWALAADPNVRRMASEGLRGLVKKDPEGVRTVLELLRTESALYARKSVANVFRNASERQPEFVLAVCREWARSRDANTRWIVRHGLQKLATLRPKEAGAILASL